MHVQLRPIDDEYAALCTALTVSEEQSAFIASNARSLETARENPDTAHPFAICADGQVVGFAMFAVEPDYPDPDDRYWLWRFMIDKNLQGRGYGSEALGEIVRWFRGIGAGCVRLSTKAGNTRAIALYRKFGFRENGDMNGEETVFQLNL